MADSFTSDTYEALCRDAEGYLARGLAEQARELLLKATDLIGTRPRARSLLADACMCLGLWEEAREQLEALSTLEINNIYTHFRLGQVLEELGDFELALDNYRVVAEINPGHHGAKVAITRIDKHGSPEQAPENPEAVPNGSQLFPDVPGTDDEFAAEEAGVDRLLTDMGLNGRHEDEGVSELLSNMGIASAEEKETEETRPALDLDSIFGGSSFEMKPAASKDDLAGIFKKAADLAEPPEAPAAGSDLDNSIDFSSIFGGSGPSEAPVPVVEEPGKVEESFETPDFASVFGTIEPSENASSEAEPEEAPVAEEPPAEEPVPEEADLSSIFGGTMAEPEAEPEAAPEEAPVAEEPPAEEPVPEEADLSSIFGGTEPEPEAKPEPAPEDAPVAEEPPAEEPVPEEADLSSIFGGTEPEPEAKPEAAPEEAPVIAEPAAEETESTEPDEAAVTEAVPVPVVAAPVPSGRYTVHPVENAEITVLHLHSGSVAVRPAFVIAMDSEVEFSSDEQGATTLTGSGTILLGQGYESAVRVLYTEGMSVRFDMLAVRPSGIVHEPLGLEQAPSLSRLSGTAEGELLFFAGGRTRLMRLNRRMTVRAEALVASDEGVLVEEGPEGWLVLSGGGRVLFTG